ncbi:MAG: tRNA threonylcarbamoyladenosine biosynthesis protein TsaE [Patescibacteria group bacterium]|nr:tRNA threonylcarbamoyladenosine biosynthesis protein TsaE [Patescibacteria group bacterium]
MSQVRGVYTGVMNSQKFLCGSVAETVALGFKIGTKLRGGEVFELVSDLGGGKTTLVRGMVQGFGSPDPVASPSFTISYVYSRPDGKQFHHFDFYRLDDAGIVGNELAEVEEDADAVVAVEWGEVVHNILPSSRVVVTIAATDEEDRKITFEYPDSYSYLFQKA